MFNHHDINRNAFMLHGPLAHQGYDWWWHSFTGHDALTGEAKPFFIEFFLCNPASGGEVVWNGRRYLVRPEDCFGYADTNWGRDFTSPWVWLSSCNLTSELTGRKLTDSVFDIGGGRPKVGPLALPRKLLSAFWYGRRDAPVLRYPQ